MERGRRFIFRVGFFLCQPGDEKSGASHSENGGNVAEGTIDCNFAECHGAGIVGQRCVVLHDFVGVDTFEFAAWPTVHAFEFIAQRSSKPTSLDRPKFSHLDARRIHFQRRAHR